MAKTNNMTIQDVSRTYAAIEAGDLSSNQKRALRDWLKHVQPGDLTTVDEHRAYLSVLQKFRQANREDMRFQGERFPEMMTSMLSVGEDGVYSNRQRFIYELIQNVDDCTYERVEDARLDIRFCYTTEPGEIILTYNETGFTPENVFSITGIAEASKNISAVKVEIGEKGIGFKSVFGIADKVRIESGGFAFELHKEDFTVPVPCYENFTPVRGTRMTLFLPMQTCEALYRSLSRQYLRPDAVLNKNPILFLNKLTHLNIYFDSFRHLTFDVQRKPPEQRGGLFVEEEVAVAVDLQYTQNDDDRSVKKSIVCTRYTMPIVYGREACRSRYKDNASIEERRHHLVLVFPCLEEDMADYRGVLYSFLPTQIKINAPVVLHVPYKLDGSREFVDPQGGNAWFAYTNERLAAFLRAAYLDFAHAAKERIVAYLPAHDDYLFCKDNEKVAALCTDELRGRALYRERIFYTTAGTYAAAQEIAAFGAGESVGDPQAVYRLLGERAPLFVSAQPVDMSAYGVRVLTDVAKRLFRRAMEEESVTADIFALLSASGEEPRYEKLLAEAGSVALSGRQCAAIAAHPRIAKAFQERARTLIALRQPLGVQLQQGLRPLAPEQAEIILEAVQEAGLRSSYGAYLRQEGFQFYALRGVVGAFALAADDGMILSADEALKSFASFSKEFDGNGAVMASLEIRQATEKLNAAEEQEMTQAEYLSLLHDVRQTLISAFSPRMYNSYLNVIKEAGADKERFLKELLQNADDCIYPAGVVPTLHLEAEEGGLKLSYNEEGFTRSNVRALTAIGESTKHRLLSGNLHAIGEKGVGFKSVFSTASSVEVHSNGFDFRLTAGKPTVPTKCEPLDVPEGTVLRIRMAQAARPKLTPARMLQLCLCLRQLRELTLYGHHVSIVDSGNRRVVYVDHTSHRYKKRTYAFTVDDLSALRDRKRGGRQISETQAIVCYVPEKANDQKMFVYSGLPVEGAASLVPLIIDAPFELTTSREEILQSPWNDVVKAKMYEAVLALMRAEAVAGAGMEVLRFVGFRTQGGQLTLANFNVPYLNDPQLPGRLKEQAVLPVLGTKCRVSAREACKIIPDFLARVNEDGDVAGCFRGYVLDTIGRTQYVPLLESLGCVKASGAEILACLKKIVPKHISEPEFRDGLYAYLSGNQGNISFEGVGAGIRDLPVFPLRVCGGTEYACFADDIYVAKGRFTDAEYRILDEAVMPMTLGDRILGGHGRLQQLTQDVLDARYQKRLEVLIQGHHEDRDVALELLAAYESDPGAFAKCKNALKGLRKEIPMRMADGTYKRGHKFRNPAHQAFAGRLMNGLVVDPRFDKMAAFLDCGNILHIHFDEMDTLAVRSGDRNKIFHLEDEDLEDLCCGQYDQQGSFENYYEIMRKAVDHFMVTDEQIAKYRLGFAVTEETDDDPDETFPSRRVKDPERLKTSIRKLWRQPNPYVEKRYIRWTPKAPVAQQNYTDSMYKSRSSEMSFCQMCKKKYPKRYTERNSIEKLPAFAWAQMHLNLCLNCSKDYILRRNNDVLWNKFITAILSANPLGRGTVDIPIGDKTVTFTATHLAEVREILRTEGWGKNAPQRKPELGTSPEDEDPDGL